MSASSKTEYLTEDPGAINTKPYTRGGFLAVEKWQTVRMPLDSIGIGDEYLGKIWIRFFSKNYTSILIDEVKLISAQ